MLEQIYILVVVAAELFTLDIQVDLVEKDLQ